MKLVLAYFFKGDLYNRFTELRRKQEARKVRLMYAKAYVDRWDNFHPGELLDNVYDMLWLKPSKKSYKTVMKLYSLNDVSVLEKELPL